MKPLRNFAGVMFEGAKAPKAERKPVLREIKAAFGGLNLEERKFVLFGGKGGCGKTTCTAALGIHLSREGRKTLVISTDPQKSLSDSFDQELLYDEITPIKGVSKLDGLEIDTVKAAEDFRERYRKGIEELATTMDILTKEETEELLELPLIGGMGLDEAMALMRIAEIVDEEKYDVIILDTAPSGHTMRLLELPDLVTEWIEFLSSAWDKVKYMIHRYRRGRKYEAEICLEDLLEKAKRVKSELLKPTTEFVPVTTLEETALMESEDLVEVVNSYGISMKNLVVNKLVPPNPKCPYCSSAFNRQQKMLERVRKEFHDFEIIAMPLFPHEIRGKDGLTKFAETLYG